MKHLKKQFNSFNIHKPVELMLNLKSSTGSNEDIPFENKWMKRWIPYMHYRYVVNFIDSKCNNLLSTHNNQFSYQCLFFTLSHSNEIFPINWEKLNNIRLFCNFIISFEFGIPISNQLSKTSSWQYFSFDAHCPCPSSNVQIAQCTTHSWKRPKTNFYLSTSTWPAFLVHKRINANIAIA